MNKYKIILIMLLAGYSISVDAQLAAYKSVIASAGASYTSPGLSADWTIGQNVANQYTSSGLIVTEGFHPVLPNQTATAVPAIVSNINSVTAYPNPTSAVLNIAIDQQVAKAVVIEVLDITGRQVGSIINLPAEVHLNAQIGMSDFRPGSYIVLLNPGTADAYTIKVIKQ